MRCVDNKHDRVGSAHSQPDSKRRPSTPRECLYRAAGLFSVTLLALPLCIGVTPAAAATCASLAGLALPDTTITAAEPIAAGTYTAPDGEVFTNLPAFCRIAATLTPTSDSNIKIEIWMPYSGWNGRFLGTGNGNLGALIVYGALGFFLTLNYAVANTDMGTSPAATDPLGGRVLTGHPEKQIDFATRSTHLLTVRAKQIIKAFYGERPNYSYFFGCSTGGGQGIHEALQFPGDYDGIVARAPQINWTHNAASNNWNSQAFNGLAKITEAQATAITAAVVKQCARKDGGLSSDNFLTDPRDCHWDPAALQCTGGTADAATCLSAPQVAAMRKFYEGPINPRTGERIYAGRVRGSESNSGYPAAIAPSSIPNWVFGNDFDPLTFDFDRDMDIVDDAMAARLNANTADLEEYKSHGGKLLLFHGFADPVIPTLNSIAYYERLITSQTREGRHDQTKQKEGLHRTQEFARLFLQPGVAHCNGGAGPDATDFLGPLVQWVEQDTAPDQIMASKIVNGVTAFTRPLCPYPALPRYSGAGDPTKASSFACVDDNDRDDNQPPAPKYLDDRDNYPIVPIDDGDHGHDHDTR
jgi:tannase/feruloyl esterase